MDYLKFMDFFSIRFHLYTHHQPRYQNAFGGIMTFLYLIICILLFLCLSYDDLRRLNPISSISEIPDSRPRTVELNKEKIWIPFRMATFEEKFVDHRGLFYILPYSVQGIYNENIGMDLKYQLLNYKLCNETEMIKTFDNYKIDVPINNLFCIDKDDIPFGGSWNMEYIKYIELNLYLCKDGVSFNSSDPRCTKIEELLKYGATNWVFEFYYPVVQYQPTDFKNPLTLVYRNYFYRISTYATKVERLYLQEHILSDDNSLIFTEYKNLSCWGTSIYYGDNYYNNFNLIGTNNSSRIFSLDIYMDKGYILYTRTYKKIFLLFSNMFPLFRLVLYFINKFTQHIKISATKRRLAGLIFENKVRERMTIINLKDSKESYKAINQIIISRIKNSKKELISNANNKNNINNAMKENNLSGELKNNYKIFKFKNIGNDKSLNRNNSMNKSNLPLRSDNTIKILNKKEISLINLKNKSNSFHDSLKLDELNKNIINNKSSKKSRKKLKFIFPYYYFFFDFIFDKIKQPQKFCFLSKSYFTVYNFMAQLYDISNYIILFKNFNLINSALLNIYEERGLRISKTLDRINIKDKTIIKKINTELKNDKSILFSKFL